MRVPCSASSRAARSASVKTVASRQAATRLRRTEVSPACAASLVCMSVQKPQPLIWLARIFTSSCVAAGRVESAATFPAAARCPRALATVVLVKRFKRASMTPRRRSARGCDVRTTGRPSAHRRRRRRPAGTPGRSPSTGTTATAAAERRSRPGGCAPAPPGTRPGPARSARCTSRTRRACAGRRSGSRSGRARWCRGAEPVQLPTGTAERRRLEERLPAADGLDDEIGALARGEVHDRGVEVVDAHVDGDVGPEPGGSGEPGRRAVRHDDARRASPFEGPAPEHPGRALSDDDDRPTGPRPRGAGGRRTPRSPAAGPSSPGRAAAMRRRAGSPSWPRTVAIRRSTALRARAARAAPGPPDRSRTPGTRPPRRRPRARDSPAPRVQGRSPHPGLTWWRSDPQIDA